MIRPYSLFRLFSIFLKRRSILDRALFLVLLSSISISSFSAAGQFYRYKNENGQLVLTQTLPAKYVDKGYDILNEKGRLVKSIPPALSAEEIKLRDEKLEAERLALIEKQKQDAIDEELKQLYSQPNDVVRVLNRKFVDIQSVVEIKRSKIENLKSQIIDEESRAAERQRKGFPVGEDAIEKLKFLKKDIVNTQIDIKELYNKLNTVLKEFDEKIKRLEVITEYQATDYPAALEAINNFIQIKD